MAWQTPFLSVLSGSDKDSLQAIFRSLQAELERLDSQIEALKTEVSKKNGGR